MDTVVLIGIVMTVTELIKKAFSKYLKIDIKGTGAVVLAVIVSIAVVFVEALKNDITVSLALFPTLIQVIFGSTIAYSIVTKKSS